MGGFLIPRLGPLLVGARVIHVFSINLFNDREQ